MRQLTIHIDFPALDQLIAYLKGQDTAQSAVDEAAAKVDLLTIRLQKSGGRLDDAVASQQ